MNAVELENTIKQYIVDVGENFLKLTPNYFKICMNNKEFYICQFALV